MKRFWGYKFILADIAAIADLTFVTTVEQYDFYKNKAIYIHDIDNDRLVLVKTFKNQNTADFFDDVIAEYNFVYNIHWRGALESKQKLTLEDAKFIFDQSEKYLKDSIDSSATIVLRVNTIITIIVAIILGLISYIVNDVRKTGLFDNTIVTSSVGVIYFYTLAFFVVRNLYPSHYFPVGSLPKNLFSKSFFLNVIPDKSRLSDIM